MENRRFRRRFLRQVILRREKQTMKRSVGVLGLLGLVCAVALPAANAAVLWQPDLSKGKIEPPTGKTLYIQAVDTVTLADASVPVEKTHFIVVTDASMTRNFG